MARVSGGNYRRFLGIFVLLIIVSAAGSLVGLPLYLRIMGTPAWTVSPCRPCVCDCPPKHPVLEHLGKLLQELYEDCGGDDPDAREEMQKDLNALLKEQLELTKAVIEESLQKNEVRFKDMKNSVEPYRREADKCRASVMTCEESREKAQAEFILEKKCTGEWESRARKMGWVEPNRVYI